MQYFGILQVPMIVKNIVCSSMRMRAQGCTWSAKWSLENKLLVRGSVVLTRLGEYTHKRESFMGMPPTCEYYVKELGPTTLVGLLGFSSTCVFFVGLLRPLVGPCQRLVGPASLVGQIFGFSQLSINVVHSPAQTHLDPDS